LEMQKWFPKIGGNTIVHNFSPKITMKTFKRV
jgi:hypothetical protein